jgi:hypothetical protein
VNRADSGLKLCVRPAPRSGGHKDPATQGNSQGDALDAAARSLVEWSRREQRLPERISDPAVVGQLATLIGATSS